MNFDRFKSIVKGNEYAMNLDLKLFRKFPEEISEIYIDYMNDILKAKELHNPKREEFIKFTQKHIKFPAGVVPLEECYINDSDL